MVFGAEINYDGLWAKLKERKMRKQDLRLQAGLTNEVIAKLGKCESVHMDALLKICKVLDCSLSEIVEARVETKSED